MSWPLAHVLVGCDAAVYIFGMYAAAPSRHFLQSDFAEYNVNEFSIVSPSSSPAQPTTAYCGPAFLLTGSTTPLLRHALLQKITASHEELLQLAGLCGVDLPRSTSRVGIITALVTSTDKDWAPEALSAAV